MSEDIFRIIYKSTAAHPAEVTLGRGHVARLLMAARQRNQAAEVSGVLVYTGLGFFQVLEGPRTGVQPIFESILVDPRHHTLAVIEMERVPERRFSGWSMGFLGTDRDLDDRLNGAGLGAVGKRGINSCAGPCCCSSISRSACRGSARGAIENGFGVALAHRL
jgi:hypothetical protein